MKPLVIAALLWLGLFSTLYVAYTDMGRVHSLEKVTYAPRN